MIQRKYAIVCLLFGLTLGFVALDQRANAARQQAQPNDKPVEQVQKNIQVLTGMASSQLLPVMHFMRTSLGVRCDYCHIAENGKYWMDDKPAKQTARRMLRMVFEINKTNFGGQPVVTCNTCHRGSTKPISVPGIGQGSFTNTTSSDDVSKTPEQLPTADQVLDRYVQAIGGKAPVDKIKTRWMKITLLKPKLVNSGTPKAAMLNRAETWTVETFQKAPNKYLSITTTPDGVFYQGFNGTVGWTKSVRGQREMNAGEVAYIKRQADLYDNLKLKDRYSELRTIGTLGDKDVYIIEARSLENKTEKLFFDAKSGRLLRRIVFTEIKLGLDPEQIDYENYREVDGVWLPFTIRVSYLDDNHYGTTRTVTKIQQNIEIDDARFEAPR